MPKTLASGDPQETTCIFKKPENLKSRIIQNINFRRKSFLIVDNMIKIPFQVTRDQYYVIRPLNPENKTDCPELLSKKRLYSSMIDQMSKLTQLWF